MSVWERDRFLPASWCEEDRADRDTAFMEAVFEEQSEVCPRVVDGLPCGRCPACRDAYERVDEEWEEAARAGEEARAQALYDAGEVW